jgi:small conductance mechanosensitive channel
MDTKAMDWQHYLSILKVWAVTHGLKIVGVVLAAFVAIKIIDTIIKRFARLLDKRHQDDPEYQKRTQTLSAVFHYTANITITVVAGMIVLRESGIDIGPILAAAGVVGLAIGFGAQSLVKDVISGFFILMEDQIRVGDVVEISGRSGVVEQVTLRMVVLRDLHGNVHYVTNGQIDTVTNMTKDFSRYSRTHRNNGAGRVRRLGSRYQGTNKDEAHRTVARGA